MTTSSPGSCRPWAQHRTLQ